MKVTALAGGTGSAKLLRGLAQVAPDLSVVANVGDNVWMHGIYVCPDIDIVMYTLAGVSNRKQGWGLEGDTFTTLKQLGRLGEETWFALGDLDLATHLVRARLMREGKDLTFISDRLRRAFGVPQPILPITNDSIETHILTPRGSLHLQEFWVRDRGRPSVRGVEYLGSSNAKLTKRVEKALKGADRVILCPANPVTSLGPMLAVPGFVSLLSRIDARIVALSPMIGEAPFSGPAAKLMKSIRIRSDSVGIASIYSHFVDSLVIDKSDAGMVKQIEEFGPECVATDTLMNDRRAEKRLAQELLAA